ncbi:hypothetical protein SYNPS1DRAFT_30272 [Syncephalis pseudoplumigaleata]|uniref:ARMET C-terminal domain-containing protein n=1 Tax=Syncephalis pseudoplumigaleata TaxID=1712513 RepID=A0A4P9YWS6_9FUNG|nr:hypothetical protein SYNPS1DRAFT_30272 [Syncephalis pseudoplumigaleata]|eukprot:RKP23952.1 hypothetical protein SYNPS1DRAFT_30272 [Syncephalis pseudoplumigaleata]
MLKRALLITLVAAIAALAVASATDEAAGKAQPLTREELSKWPIKKLKQFLNERDVACVGCVEKSDFIDTVLEHADTPTKEEEEPEKEQEEEEKEEEGEAQAEDADGAADDAKTEESGEKFKLTDEMFDMVRDAMSKEEGMDDFKKDDVQKIFDMFPQDMAKEMFDGFLEGAKQAPGAAAAETAEEEQEEEQEEKSAEAEEEEEEEEEDAVKDEL